jgi:hypothetical protein
MAAESTPIHADTVRGDPRSCMEGQEERTDSSTFLKSLGFPELRVRASFSRFDFTPACRRIVFFIRSALDSKRFPDYLKDALPYRGGYVRHGSNIAEIKDSFDLEKVIAVNPEAGTWVIAEAAFYVTTGHAQAGLCTVVAEKLAVGAARLMRTVLAARGLFHSGRSAFMPKRST